jgi:hypothetical protein
VVEGVGCLGELGEVEGVIVRYFSLDVQFLLRPHKN